MNLIKTTILSATLILFGTTLNAKSQTIEYLGLFSKKDKVYVVGTGDDKIEIKRTMTSCAKNKGFFQPFSPVKGITPVTEADMLRALNDKDSVVVDMRVQEQYLKSTIPTAVNIPYGEIEVRLDEFGCTELDRKWDCKNAKKVYGFCNGPVCTQSPVGMKAMVKKGFPADKIYYYRGGILNWAALGLTMVPGEF